MTDLSAKFAALELQVATQHAELMAAIDAIAVALGAAPPAGTTTLAELLGALDQLIIVDTGIRSDMAIQQGLLLDTVGLINVSLETLSQNNSYNAQVLLRAIQLNDPCRDCAVLPIDLPPIGVTPGIVDTVHCQRMQALIYALYRMSVKLDILSAFGIGFSMRIVTDAIEEIKTELGVSLTLLTPSLPELAQLASAGAAYVAFNIFGGNSIPSSYQTIQPDLLAPLYAADTASAGQAAYRAVINASALPAPIKNLLSAMGYIELFNLYYDRSIEISLAGYDGDICVVVVDCLTFISPTDPHTQMHSGYTEVLLDQIPGLFARVTAETTIESNVRAEMCINPFNYEILLPNTPTLWSSFLYHTYVSSDQPETSMTITICNLAPE